MATVASQYEVTRDEVFKLSPPVDDDDIASVTSQPRLGMRRLSSASVPNGHLYDVIDPDSMPLMSRSLTSFENLTMNGYANGLTLKEKILLRYYEKMTSGDEADRKDCLNFGHNLDKIFDDSNKTSELLERLRINREKLRDLLEREPFNGRLGDNWWQQTNEELPFQSGPLRFSVYRSTSSNPQKNDVTRRSANSHRPAVKPRPFSETFVISRNIGTLDISSSSDDEVTDPVPESPLNLSDSESMASNSPSLINRRRFLYSASSQQRVTSSNRDARPKSLYDSAKPQPPRSRLFSTGTKVESPAKDEDHTFGGRFSRFISASRPWKHHKENRKHFEQDPKSPPTVPQSCWTNVVGSNSVQCEFQPHPPLRSYASSNSYLRPVRKKRQAPDIPINLAVNDETRPPLEKSLSAPESNLPSTDPPISDSSQSKDVPSVEQSIELKEEQSVTMSQPMAFQETEDSGIYKEVSEKSGRKDEDCSQDAKKSSITRIEEENKEALGNSLRTGDDEHGEEDEVRLQQAVPGDGNLLQEIQEILGDNQDGISVLPASLDVQCCPDKSKVLAEVSSSETIKDEVSELTQHQENIPVTSIVKDDIQAEVEHSSGIETTLEEVLLTESQNNSKRIPPKDSHHSLCHDKEAEEQKNNSNVTIAFSSYDYDVIDGHGKSSDDEIMKHVIADTSQKDKKRHKNKNGHRDSNENASSGYSSPGSADEGATSPEIVTSLMSSLPSPTSSYYSSSLSASSSRVSDMSRELTLMTSCKCNDVKEQSTTIEPTNKLTNKQITNDEQQRHSATDINMNDVPTRRRSTSTFPLRVFDENALITDKRRAGTVTESSSGISDVPVVSKPGNFVKLRDKQVPKIRPKSEYIPYSSNRNTWVNAPGSRVSICMVERPGDSYQLSSRVGKQNLSSGFKVPHSSAKKKSHAPGRNRAFGIRHKNASLKADGQDFYINGGSPEVPSSNLVSHFVSTHNISCDVTNSKITSQEILNLKREEFLKAFRNNSFNRSGKFGGSVQQLPVTTQEFSTKQEDVIHEDNEVVDSSIKSPDIVPDDNKEISEGKDRSESATSISVHRQSSGSNSSTSSGCSKPPSLFNGSTWSVNTDMTSNMDSNQTVRAKKSSLKKRIQGAFSFQNIRRAVSMEKLNEEEKRKSMSHYYLNESGTHDVIGRTSSTLPPNCAPPADAQPRMRKAPSLTSIVSTVRMRKRRSKMLKDNRNRYTISDPSNLPQDFSGDVTIGKRSSMRPMSLIMPSYANRVKSEDVGSPSYFRPIGRVLQMNPVEGSLLVEMVKPTSGSFGFYIARKKEDGDRGSVFISRLSDSYPDKMFTGLMRTGDEITEVNGSKVSGLSLDQVYDLILDSERTLLKIKPAQVHVV